MMHSCDAAPPPVQGAALLLELGTLIIEGRATPRHPHTTAPPLSAPPHNAYGRASSAELHSQQSPERFHSRNGSFGSQEQRNGEDPEQSNINATIATIKDTNNTTDPANSGRQASGEQSNSFVRNASLERLINLNTPSAASTAASFAWNAGTSSLEQSNNLNTPSAAVATANLVRSAGAEQSNNPNTSSAAAGSAGFGGGGGSEDGEVVRRKEDVHRKLLSALLGAKIYQRVQFGNGEEDQEKAGTSTHSPVGTRGRGRALALRGHAEALWREHIPLCIEVLLAPDCSAGCRGPLHLLERWTMSIYTKRAQDPANHITSQWLLKAVRSQLHFSQISAWGAKIREEEKTKEIREQSPSERQRKLSRETCNFKKYEANCDEEDKDENQDKKKNLNVVYCLKIPGETYRISEFKVEPVKHTFPITDIGSNVFLKVLLESLPRVEEVPVVRCACLSSNPSTLKRRRSKDMMNAAMSEEMLANSLAAVCSLAEDNATCSRMNYQGLKKMDGLSDDCKSRIKGATFSPDLGIINPDMGCASGITRKLSAYSSPNSDVYCAPNSRGSTPEQSDLNDSGFSCSTGTPCEGPLHKACKRKSKVVDSSYQFYDESNIQVPSDSVVNYVLVDDRMQTPCRQKGKHRCNCDEESDQGVQLQDAKNTKQKSEEGKVDEKINVLDERRAKEIAKYMRRLRKEAKLKQRESGMSSQDNSECKQEHSPKVKFNRRSASRHNDLISNTSANGEATTQYPSSGLDPGRQKNSVPEGTSTKVAPNNETANSTKVPKQTANPKPSSDSHSATSIPILQASRFDHALRMGNYRTSVSLHGALSSREVYTIKDFECVCSSIGCDQMASVKSCSQFEDINPKTYHVGSQNKHCQISCCHPDEASGRLSDSNDNYQPSVKKLISSYTQTDNYACDCGKPLVPKCFDCSNNLYAEEMDDSGFSREGGMRRSRGTHDLTTINKSDLFLEAIERCSRLPGRTAHQEVNAMDNCDKDNENSASSVEVAPNKCDSSNSVINKCQCDKNIFNINSGNNSSCSNDYNMISRASAYGDRFAKDISHSQSDRTDQTDITLNNNDNNSTTSKNSSLLQNSDKAVDFIRKPKHKRPSPFNKIEKIMMERIEQKQKDTPKSSNPIKIANRADYFANEFGNEQDEDFLYKDEASGITYMTNSNTYLDHTSNTYKSFPPPDSVENYSKNREQHVVMYEKGDYANFVHIESKQMGKHAYEDVESDCGHSCKHFRGDEDGIHFIGDAPQNWDIEGNEDLNAFGKSLESGAAVPSVSEMDRFRWRLDSAASMVFHSRTGLPLTSSPAPLRRGKSCFDFDSSINSVSGIKSALYGLIPDLELSCQPWSPGSSPGSPLPWGRPPSPGGPPCVLGPAALVAPTAPTLLAPVSSTSADVLKVSSKRKIFRHGTTSGLLGSFEESVLNGRLEPAATVAGFTAEIGASGSFCPAHLKLPVTVFFYSLGDNTTSAPYLGHINLGRRGYNVPRAGTIQATLFNPHGTVVKMFVVMYDMADMPANSKTFLRQRTLCVPAVACQDGAKPDPRALRYLIHLRFLTSKSGKVYLHTDIRIIVSRKADLDTAHSLNSAISMQLQNGPFHPESTEGRKKKTVETGTFEKRSKKVITTDISSRINRNFGAFESDLNSNEVKKKMNRSDGCFELAAFCAQNGGSDSEKDEENNARSRSNSISKYASKELSYELRSFTYGPDNPKYSPR